MHGVDVDVKLKLLHIQPLALESLALPAAPKSPASAGLSIMHQAPTAYRGLDVVQKEVPSMDPELRLAPYLGYCTVIKDHPGLLYMSRPMTREE